MFSSTFVHDPHTLHHFRYMCGQRFVFVELKALWIFSAKQWQFLLPLVQNRGFSLPFSPLG